MKLITNRKKGMDLHKVLINIHMGSIAKKACKVLFRKQNLKSSAFNLMKV